MLHRNVQQNFKIETSRFDTESVSVLNIGIFTMHRYDENLTESVTGLYLRKKTNEVIYINFNDMQVSARSL